MRNWWKRRLARLDMAVLGCLVEGDIYVYDMWRHIGGNAGRIYASLARLESQGKAWSMWAEQPEGPRRRRYGVTKAVLDARAWESR